jgi:hypothetical protein
MATLPAIQARYDASLMPDEICQKDDVDRFAAAIAAALPIFCH